MAQFSRIQRIFLGLIILKIDRKINGLLLIESTSGSLIARGVQLVVTMYILLSIR